MIDLYRFYDKADQLLYIGISLSAAQRASQHRKTQGWWPLVARMEVEHLDVTRGQIEALERAAIQNERPRYNVVHNGVATVKKTNWTCGTCRVPVTDGYVQIADCKWVCVCKRCDDGSEEYFIELGRIDTYDDVAIWTKHLLGKSWFSLVDWETMLRQSCQIPQWYAAMLYGRDADRQNFWIHRQSA